MEKGVCSQHTHFYMLVYVLPEISSLQSFYLHVLNHTIYQAFVTCLYPSYSTINICPTVIVFGNFILNGDRTFHAKKHILIYFTCPKQHSFHLHNTYWVVSTIYQRLYTSASNLYNIPAR